MVSYLSRSINNTDRRLQVVTHTWRFGKNASITAFLSPYHPLATVANARNATLKPKISHEKHISLLLYACIYAHLFKSICIKSIEELLKIDSIRKLSIPMCDDNYLMEKEMHHQIPGKPCSLEAFFSSFSFDSSAWNLHETSSCLTSCSRDYRE